MSNRQKIFIVSPPKGVLNPSEIIKVQIKHKGDGNIFENRYKFLAFIVESDDFENVDWKKSIAEYTLTARLEVLPVKNFNGPIARIQPIDSIVFQSYGPGLAFSELIIENCADQLRLEPSDELIFTPIGKLKAIAFLKIYYSGQRSICFKIKTNYPKLFIVSPNKGVLSPLDILKVQINHTGKGNAFENGCKFLAVFVESDDFENVDWKKSIAEYKLTARLEVPPVKNFNSLIARIQPIDSIVFQSSGPGLASSELIIENLTDNKIAFRIKTTHPSEFIVSPAKGIIEGLNQIQVKLSYKSSNDSLPPSRKFLISCCQSDELSSADWTQGVSFQLSANLGQNS